MTNQQWSVVGVVNDFLDPQRVQYSLLPQGGANYWEKWGIKGEFTIIAKEIGAFQP